MNLHLSRDLLSVFGLFCCLGLSGCSGCNQEEDILSVAPEDRVAKRPVESIPTDDWKSWRGPEGNGIAPSKTAPQTWNSSSHVLWSVEIPGRGHSSPTVVKDRIFLTTADESEKTQSVLCLSRTDGSELWQKEIHRGNFPSDVHKDNSYASSTIACTDDQVFAVFLNDDSVWVTALDWEGNQLWQKAAGGFDSKQGYAPSPVLYDNLVIVAADHQSGGYLAGLNMSDGEIVWKTDRPAISSYSSPIVAHVAEKDQLLISGCDLVSSYNPRNGDLYWEVPGTTKGTVGTMVWEEDRVYAAGGYPDKQVICVKADGSKEVLWSDKVKIYVPSMVINQGYLYAVNDDGIAYCWDAKTGDLRWRVRVGGNFSSSPVLVYDSIYITDKTGRTILFEANPNEFKKIGENKLGDEAFASPVICDGQLFLRVAEHRSEGRQEILYCIGEKESLALRD